MNTLTEISSDTDMGFILVNRVRTYHGQCAYYA